MNSAFAGWWLARGVFVRRLIKLVLALLAFIGVLLFVSFNMTANGSRASGTKMIVTIGQPTPWLVWERITAAGVVTNADGSSTTLSMRAESGVHILTTSFGAGMLAIYSLVLLGRIAGVEKQRRGA